MKTRKIIIVSSLLIALSIGIFSCKKFCYRDGPSFTLVTKKSRLAHSWVIQSVTLDSTNDITSQYSSTKYVEVFDKDGYFSKSSTSGLASGKWVFQNNGFDLIINGNGISEIRHVLKLRNSEFWYYTNIGGKKEFHLVRY